MAVKWPQTHPELDRRTDPNSSQRLRFGNEPLQDRMLASQEVDVLHACMPSRAYSDIRFDTIAGLGLCLHVVQFNASSKLVV